MKKKIITILLVIFSFFSGIFIGVYYEKVNDKGANIEIQKPVREITIEREMDYFLYGCPNSKKVKRPIIKRIFSKKF